MSRLKTKPTEIKVEDFLNAVDNEKKRQDSYTIIKIMKEITKQEPYMWGPSIIGFGTYHYKYDSGHEGDAPVAGFSPRKDAFSIYIMAGFTGYQELMDKLGKYKMGKACLYVKKLEDIDIEILKELIKKSVEYCKQIYP